VAALLDDDPRKEGAILDVIDDDVADRRAQFTEDRFEQIVRHRALWFVPLHGERNRIRLEGADPDRQIAPTLGFAQDDDTVLCQQTHADAVNSYTDHRSTFLRIACTFARSKRKDV
jgi:hypothetical protein